MKRILAIFTALILFFPVIGAGASASIKLPIVMYHHISPEKNAQNEYVISPEEFRSDMEYLKREGWESISLDELVAWTKGEFEMPEKPMMITFDDGFSSTAAYAEPVMRELGYRGLVAVIGSECQRYSESGEYDPLWSDMSWEQAAAMADRGVLGIQCHTWDMHRMDKALGCNRRKGESVQAYRRRLSADLSRFLTACENNGLDICPSIAYPFGAFGEDTTEAVRDMGFIAAFTCTEEINILTGDGDELYYLGRFNRPHGISSEKFFKKWENNS